MVYETIVVVTVVLGNVDMAVVEDTMGGMEVVDKILEVAAAS